MTDVTNSSNTENYDAQQAAEEIATGDRKAPDVNVEADYEASKQFSTSDIDNTEAGAQAAAAATESQFEVPEPEATTFNADTTGNPEDYREMAKDVNPAPTEATAASSDALLQKAFEKGKAAE